MKYSTHRILKNGNIEIRQVKDGQFYRHVIAPNQPIDGEPADVKRAILADVDYSKYRTQENSDDYERKFKTPEQAESERRQRLIQQAEKQARDEALESLLEERIDRVKLKELSGNER